MILLLEIMVNPEESAIPKTSIANTLVSSLTNALLMPTIFQRTMVAGSTLTALMISVCITVLSEVLIYPRHKQEKKHRG